MKTVSGKVTSTIPISISNAAKSLSKFASSDHGASHAVSFYIQRAADSFNHLVNVHQKLNPNFVKNREVGLDVEDIVKNEDIPNGSLDNTKIKNLVKEEEIKTEQLLGLSDGETVKSMKNELEFVKIEMEDGMKSRDEKKKKKKKYRGVGDYEQEVGKVEVDLGNKAEEKEGEKTKSMDHDAGENAGSMEMSSKKKSKKRRIEGDK